MRPPRFWQRPGGLAPLLLAPIGGDRGQRDGAARGPAGLARAGAGDLLRQCHASAARARRRWRSISGGGCWRAASRCIS